MSLLLSAALWHGPDLYRTAFTAPQQFALLNEVPTKVRLAAQGWNRVKDRGRGRWGGESCAPVLSSAWAQTYCLKPPSDAHAAGDTRSQRPVRAHHPSAHAPKPPLLN